MRKLLMALCTVFMMAGLVVAAEKMVNVTSYKDGELKVKEGEDDKVYKIGDKTKFYTTDAKGENKKEATKEDFERRFSRKGGGGGKRGNPATIEVDDDNVTSVTWRSFMRPKD